MTTLRSVTFVRQSDSHHTVMIQPDPLHVRSHTPERSGRSDTSTSTDYVPQQGRGRDEGPASEVSRMRAEIDELHARLAASETRLAQVEGRLQRILSSRSYRLARRLAGVRRRAAVLVGVRGAADR